MKRTHVGDIIRIRRESLGYSQAEFANKIGVSQQNVSYWESNARLPRLDSLKDLLHVLDLTIDELLGGVPLAAMADHLDPELLNAWRQLSGEDRQRLVSIAKVFVEQRA